MTTQASVITVSDQSVGPVVGLVPRMIQATFFAAIVATLTPVGEALAALWQAYMELLGPLFEVGIILPVFVLFVYFVAAVLHHAGGRSPIFNTFEDVFDGILTGMDRVVVTVLPVGGDTDVNKSDERIEAIHREYREGEIGDVELEKRLDTALSEQEDVEPAVEVEDAE